MRLHSTPLVSHREVPTLQEGKVVPLDHSRLGFVGWIVYWILGNCVLAVKIIVVLICKLNLTESVFETLTPIITKYEVETNAKIVILMKTGLDETKYSRTKHQRQELTTKTRDTMFDTQTLVASECTNATGSGCPTDDILTVIICIVPVSAGAKTPSTRER